MDKNVIKREYNKILAFTEMVVYLIYSSNLTQLNIKHNVWKILDLLTS